MASPEPIVEHIALNRPQWICNGCGGRLKRGDPIRVTITPGGGANRVEHDPSCPKPMKEAKKARP